MPVCQTEKKFVCACGKRFKRAFDFSRHKKTHRRREEREFGCHYEGCNFRANQKGGLLIHLNSGEHDNVRSPCKFPGCGATFSDPSGVSRHKRDAHRAGTPVTCARSSSANPPTPKRDEYKKAKTSPVLSQPIPSNPPSGALSHGASSTSVYRPDHPTQPSPDGGFHPTADVQPDCRLIDHTIQTRDLAYNANPRTGSTSSGYHPNDPVPSNASILHPQLHNHIGVIQTSRGQPYHASMGRNLRSLTLAPPRRNCHDIVRAQHQSAALPSGYQRSHVYPSHQRTLGSSAYLRLNSGMLFDN